MEAKIYHQPLLRKPEGQSSNLRCSFSYFMGHKGRPQAVDEELNLNPVCEKSGKDNGGHIFAMFLWKEKSGM